VLSLFYAVFIIVLLSINEIKEQLGNQAAQLVQQDMIIGIGSGSTVFHFINALAEKIHDGLKCIAVPTSEQTRLLAVQKDVELAELNDIASIDLTIDGADEIDPQLQLIKGGGGFLLQEKMVAAASKQLVIIADYSKLVAKPGHFPLPVEVIPYGWKQVQHRIKKIYEIKVELRKKDDKPFITDHGHYILDCYFQQITDPAGLNTSLHLIPGVVETGLFINMADIAIIGYPDGSIKKLYAEKK
jgi:ribose 5-phosphate isomerase A